MRIPPTLWWEFVDPVALLDCRVGRAIKGVGVEGGAGGEAALGKLLGGKGGAASRRHHYVPRFLLERFGEGGRVTVIRGAKAVSTSVANVAVRKDFYTVVDDDGGDSDVVERAFSIIEGAASSALRKAAVWGPSALSPADRFSVGAFVALQYMRGPDQRRFMEAIADQMAKLQLQLEFDPELREAFGAELDAERAAEWEAMGGSLDGVEVVAPQNELIRLILDGVAKTAPLLAGMAMTVVRYPDGGLVLSDSPVVLSVDTDPGPYGVGLLSADDVILPLDREHALVLHYRFEFDGLRLTMPLVEMRDALVARVVAGSHEEVYCHPDDVEKVLLYEFPPESRPILQAFGGLVEGVSSDGVNAPMGRVTPRRYPVARGWPAPDSAA